MPNRCGTRTATPSPEKSLAAVWYQNTYSPTYCNRMYRMGYSASTSMDITYDNVGMYVSELSLEYTESSQRYYMVSTMDRNEPLNSLVEFRSCGSALSLPQNCGGWCVSEKKNAGH